MNIVTQIGLVLGLLLLIGLLIWQGAAEVLQLLANSGWNLLCLPLAWLPSLLPATQGWRILLASRHPPSFIHALLALWMGRAVNNLLPVATIGGEIAKARLIHFWGVKGVDAAASVMVDKVIQAISVALWGLVGVGCLLYLSEDRQLALYALLGFTLLAASAVGFLYLQKAGMLGLLSRLGGKLVKTTAWDDISVNAREIDAVVSEIYRKRANIIKATLLRTLGLLLETVEVWLACYLLGHPLGVLEALMLKSLTSTLRDIAFIIPNGYGIQEGAFILVGALLGIDANTSLAVSLAIRIRDLVFDPAGLLAFHQIESRQFALRRQSRQSGAGKQDISDA